MSKNVEQSLLACLYRYKDSPFDDERNDELVHELTESELRINVLWKRISILNQVAEYLLISVENKQEKKLKLSKLNITDKIGIDVVEKELNKLDIQI